MSWYFWIALVISKLVFAIHPLEEKHSYLYSRCAQKHASSCASLASLVIKEDSKLAYSYYKKACDLGKESSCIFSKTNSIENLPAVPFQYKLEPSDVGFSNPSQPIHSWYEKTLKYYATNFVLTSLYNPKVEHFTTLGCGLRTYATRNTPYSEGNYRFGDKCDLEGISSSVKITGHSRRININYKMKNMYDIVAVTGVVLMTSKIVEGASDQFFIESKMRDGIFFDKNRVAVAKFEFVQEWYFRSINDDQQITPLSAKGFVTVTEFRGKPTNFRVPLVISSEYFGRPVLTR